MRNYDNLWYVYFYWCKDNENVFLLFSFCFLVLLFVQVGTDAWVWEWEYLSDKMLAEYWYPKPISGCLVNETQNDNCYSEFDSEFGQQLAINTIFHCFDALTAAAAADGINSGFLKINHRGIFDQDCAVDTGYVSEYDTEWSDSESSFYGSFTGLEICGIFVYDEFNCSCVVIVDIGAFKWMTCCLRVSIFGNMKAWFCSPSGLAVVAM